MQKDHALKIYNCKISREKRENHGIMAKQKVIILNQQQQQNHIQEKDKNCSTNPNLQLKLNNFVLEVSCEENEKNKL